MKKLYRSDQNKVVAGVCGGLGEYFEIDPVVVRVIFVLLALPGGGGLIIYLLLFFLIPARSAIGTPAEDLRDLGARTRAAAEELRAEAERLAGDLRSARATRRRTRHEWGTLLGLILVLTGGFALLDAMFPMSWFSWSRAWPIIVITIGIFLVARSLGRGSEQ